MDHIVWFDNFEITYQMVNYMLHMISIQLISDWRQNSSCLV